jgi:hypothetical protein
MLCVATTVNQVTTIARKVYGQHICKGVKLQPPNNIVLKKLRPREQGQHLNTLKRNYCHLFTLL